ncbi:hypothetical protein GA0115233_10805 [Streptomyces sp. DI166]|nr:hypothetical protein GA0115233_10805 [Streptomyces sp. DI166]
MPESDKPKTLMISWVSGDPEDMSHVNPDPEPERTTGLEPGGSVPPGETPPAESSLPEAGPRETHNPPTGWARTPLLLILALAVLIAAFFLVYAIVLAV